MHQEELEPESLGSIGAAGPADGTGSHNESPIADGSGGRSGAKTALPLNDVDIDGLIHNEFDDLAKSEKAKSSKDDMDFVNIAKTISEHATSDYNGDSYSIQALTARNKMVMIDVDEGDLVPDFEEDNSYLSDDISANSEFDEK